MVLDHIAKPFIKAGTIEPWRSQILELARFPNLLCKISGMVTEADHLHWKAPDFQPFLETVVAAFGPERLMFGTDWPVCRLAATYEAFEGLVRYFFRGWSPAQSEAFYGGNGARCYSVSAPISSDTR